MKKLITTLMTSVYALSVLLCVGVIFSIPAFAVQCLDVFPDAHPENRPSFNSFSFPTFNGTTDINRNQNANFSISQGNYRNITVGQNSTVRFSTANGNYRIKSLQIFNRSTIEFEPGDYWIESLHFGYTNTLKISSPGTVRIFVKNRFRTYQNNKWNKDENGSLVIYAGQLAVNRNNKANNGLARRLNFTGAIYTDNLTFNHNSMLVEGKGSLASRNDVTNNRTNSITYSQSIVTNTDFKNLCELAIPISGQWNLDELSWPGTNSVIDSIGSNHGTPSGGLFPTSNNPVFNGNPGTCNSGSFDGQNDYFEVDNTLGNDFTMMAWIRPTVNFPTATWPYQGSGLFWSDVGGAGSDFLAGGIFRNGANRIAFMVGGTGSDQRVESGPIQLNQWTHVAITRHRSSGVISIFLNGVLSGSQTTNNSNTLTSNPVIGIGGNPNDNRYFEGNIDEVKFYDGALFSTQILEDMNDTRVCPINAPTVEYRFDNFHTFAPGSVLDSSGSNNHGTAFTASNAQGLLCTAADFSATGDANYIVADRDALNGLSDFTAMAWIQTIQTHDATIFSAASSNSSLGTNEAVFYLDDSNRFWPTITASPFNTSTRLGSTHNINDGQWHQVVWTREAATKRSCFFVDGQAQGCVIHDDGNDTSPIGVAENGLVIGQEQDALGGDFEVNQSFDGLMDEFMIFDYVLEESAINVIDQNIRSNKNWDGTPRAACPIAFPVVDMRFDEASWSGAGSVLDSSGSNFHGTPFGSAAPISGMSCNAVDLTQTGTTDYISLSNQAINGLQDFSVVFWGKMEASNNMAAVSGANNSQNNEFLLFFEHQTGSSIRVRPFVKGQNSFFDSFTNDQEWHQYAWTREASTGQVCLYRDGVKLGNCQTGFTTSPLTVSPNGFVIGQEQDNVGGDFDANQAWNGLIDELLIFPTVLSQAQIQEYRQNIIEGKDWSGAPKACVNTVDHYRFNFSAEGLTCAASSVILKACENANCSSNATINTSVGLSPSGKWTGIDVTDDSVSFTGSTDLFLSQNSLATIAIGANSLNPVPSSAIPVQCFNGSTAIDCEIAFKDTGFLFNQIPTQISAKPSNVEFNQKELTIQAVTKNTTTGACENVFPEDTDVEIALKTNCVTASCNDAFITREDGTAVQIDDTFSNVTLTFGADSTAKYTYTYFDAAEMSLTARKEVTLPSGAETTLEGNSNNFVIKPFGFKLSFVDDLNDPDDSDPYSDGNPSGDFSKFKKAGKAFKVNVVPIMWQSGEDGDPSVPTTHDGNIDADENPDGNLLVADFSNETVQFTHQLVLPVGGSDGNFSATETDQNLNNATVSFNVSWSEVGIINLITDLSDSNYRGAGNVIGYANGVGRFYPDHFTVSDLVTGDLAGQCINQTFIGETTVDGADSDTAADGALKYYSTNPAMRINAMPAGATPATLPLNNYRGDFMRLQDGSVTFSSSTSTNGLAVNSVIETGTINESVGVVIFTMSDNDNFVFDRNNAAKVAPFSATLNFPVAQVEDQDEVVLKADVSATLSASSKDGHNVVYGRVKLHNVFGPDNQALAMPVEHQMYNGSEFVTNTVIGADCSYPVIPSSDFSLTPSPFGDLTATSLTATPLTWLSGKASLQIPASNLSGTLQLELDVPAWLRFDWDNNAGSADTNPRANAIFGRYRGNDRIINWRERR